MEYSGGEVPGDDYEMVVDSVVALADLSLDFSRVERATYHQDGERHETDSDHTVMLGLIACALAARLRPDLDVGRVAQYSLVHDFVEVYAGDTVALRLSEAGRADKEVREAAALRRLQGDFAGTLPWLTNTIEEYESLADPEARFVKTVDKLLPKLTHLLNDVIFLRREAVSRAEIEATYGGEPAVLAKYGFDHPELAAIAEIVRRRVIDQY